MSKYFVLSVAVLLLAAGQGADAAIRVTHCFGPTNLTRATCSGNCSSFVVNEGQCFSQSSYVWESIRCMPARARCVDVEEWMQPSCSPAGTGSRSQNPCGMCQNYVYLKCTDTSMTYMSCSDSQCKNCQPQFNATVGQCVPLPFPPSNNSFKVHAINACKLYNMSTFMATPCTPANEAYSYVDVSGSCTILDHALFNSVSTRFTCVSGRLTTGQSNTNLAAYAAFVKQHGLQDAVSVKARGSTKKSVFGH